MTLNELKQFRWLKREIEIEKERLEELEAQSLGAVKLGEASASSGETRKTENYAIAVAKIRETLTEKINDYTTQRAKVECYIADIDDSLIRQIITLRFVEALNWEDVAAKIGGGNTEASVKMMCYRYIENHDC